VTNPANQPRRGPVVIAAATAPERKACSDLTNRRDTASQAAVSLQTGVGPLDVNALIDQLRELGAGGVISVGTAGGLTPNAITGTIVLPRQIGRPGQASTPVDDAWHRRILAKLEPKFDIRCESLVTVNRVVRSPEQKQALHQQDQAIAVDMESADLAAAAAGAGIPFVALRVVLDTVHDTIPASIAAAVDPAGNPRPLALLGMLLKRPRDTVAVCNIAWQLRTATSVLREVTQAADTAILRP
jgi:adenosylhomocysteine nucleosidase